MLDYLRSQLTKRVQVPVVRVAPLYASTRKIVYPFIALALLFLGKLAATLRTPSTVALMHMEVLGDTSASCHAGRGQYQKCEIALPVLGPPAEPAGFIAALLITTICHKFRVIVRIYSRQRPG